MATVPTVLFTSLRDVSVEIARGRRVEGGEVFRSLQIRCPEVCGCRRKLLATLVDFPETAFDSGAVLQLVCPSKKTRLIRIVL